GAALHIGLGPGPGPVILSAELGKAEPVAQRKLGRIADALPTLHRRIDKEHPAKAFAGQAAENSLLVAIEQKDGFSAVQEIERRRDAGYPSPHDQDVKPVHLVSARFLKLAGYHGLRSFRNW